MDPYKYFASQQEFAEREARGVASQDSAFDTFVKGAAVVAGISIAGRRFLETEAGITALGTFGRTAGRIIGGIKEGSRFLGSALTNQEFTRRPTMRLELVEAAEQALRVYDRAAGVGVSLRGNAASQQLATTLNEGLGRWGFTGRQINGIRSVTAQDALQTMRGEIGESAAQTLERAMGLGIVNPEMAVHTGRAGLYRDAAGRILDTRMFKPETFLRGVHEVTRQIKVPFTDFRPADLLASIVRPFGRGAFAGEIAPGMQITKGIRAPTGGMSFGIAGELHSDFGLGGSFSAVSGAGRIRLGRAGTREAQAHLERMGMTQPFIAPELRRRINSGNSGFFRSLIDSVQAAAGVGPAFSTKTPVWKAPFDAYKRRVGGTVVPLPYIEREQSETFIQKLLGQISGNAQDMRDHVPNTKPLGWWDRFKAYFGASKRATVIRNDAQGLHSASDIAIPSRFGARATPGMRPVVSGDPVRYDMFGNLKTEAPLEYFAARNSIGESLLDIGHMMTNRLNDLSSATFGMGFRPSTGGVGGLVKNVGKLYGLYAAVNAGAQYANYADYLAEEYTGISPKKLLMTGFGAARVAQQAIRGLTGISAGLDYAEDLMPKSVDSGLSWLARTVAPPVLGAFLGGRGGLMAGLGVAAAVGGTDPSQSASDLIQEYKGEKLVPIRKSRYWMLGRQPFEGGQIDYFAPGWFAREMSDYQFTSTQYGSKSEYYGNVAHLDMPLIGSVPLPTPSNAFGLLPAIKGEFFDGGSDYLARKHRYDRPYPDTPGVDQDKAMSAAALISSRGPYDAPEGAGQRLEMGTEGNLGQLPAMSTGMGARIADATDKLTELGGIYKFMLWDMPGFAEKGRPELATSESIGSQSREFYDRQVGGAFGLTELYRRFLPPPEKGINPMVNQMPDWLPGARSAYEGDRAYHIDYTLGDPYAKLKMGEFRLPGEAYERLHRLHSGTAGIYDPVDRFLILADVAPNSQAFKEYKTIVDAWKKAGVLDDYWRGKINDASSQVKERMEKFQFVHRRFTGMITDPDPEKTEAKYSYLEKGIGAGWEVLTHDLIPKMGDTIPLAGPLLSDKLMVARSPIEQYLRNEVYGEEFADWKSPWKAFLRPKLNLLSNQDAGTAMLGGAAFGLMGASPGAGLMLGLAGIAATSVGQMKSGINIPGHRQDEWELQEYFDKIRYVKSEMLMNRAEELGDTELANYYKTELSRTVTNLNYSQGTQQYIGSALKALPRNLKSYFIPFMEMPRQAQEEILPYLPEDIQPVFANAWMRPAGASFDLRNSLGARYNNVFRTSPDSAAAQYFETNTMPDSDWAGWHPDVPLDAVKIKMVDAGSNSVAADMHKFDLYPEHRFRASKFDNIEPIMGDMEHVEPILNAHVNLENMLREAGFSNVNVRMGAGGQGGVTWNTRYDRRKQLQPYYGSALR